MGSIIGEGFAGYVSKQIRKTVVKQQQHLALLDIAKKNCKEYRQLNNSVEKLTSVCVCLQQPKNQPTG